jgi:heme exporter protein CcmD
MTMPWMPYLVAAYAVTVVLLAGMLLLSLGRLRRLEKTLQEER